MKVETNYHYDNVLRGVIVVSYLIKESVHIVLLQRLGVRNCVYKTRLWLIQQVQDFYEVYAKESSRGNLPKQSFITVLLAIHFSLVLSFLRVGPYGVIQVRLFPTETEPRRPFDTLASHVESRQD